MQKDIQNKYIKKKYIYTERHCFGHTKDKKKSNCFQLYVYICVCICVCAYIYINEYIYISLLF